MTDDFDPLAHGATLAKREEFDPFAHATPVTRNGEAVGLPSHEEARMPSINSPEPESSITLPTQEVTGKAPEPSPEDVAAQQKQWKVQDWIKAHPNLSTLDAVAQGANDALGGIPRWAANTANYAFTGKDIPQNADTQLVEHEVERAHPWAKMASDFGFSAAQFAGAEIAGIGKAAAAGVKEALGLADAGAPIVARDIVGGIVAHQRLVEEGAQKFVKPDSELAKKATSEATNAVFYHNKSLPEAEWLERIRNAAPTMSPEQVARASELGKAEENSVREQFLTKGQQLTPGGMRFAMSKQFNISKLGSGELAPDVAKQAAASAVGSAVNGVLGSAPRALGTALGLSDESDQVPPNGGISAENLKRAGETLAWNGLIPAVASGVAVPLAGSLLQKTESLTAKALAHKLAPTVTAYLPSYGIASSALHGVVHAVAPGIGNIGGVAPIHFASRAIGDYAAEKASKVLIKQSWDQLLGHNTIPAALTTTLGVLFKGANAVVGGNAVKESGGLEFDNSLFPDEHFEPTSEDMQDRDALRLGLQAQQYGADPEAFIRKTAGLTSHLENADQVTRQALITMHQTAAQAMQYVGSLAPKPQLPEPFQPSNQEPDRVDPAQVQKLKTALTVMTNPSVVIKRYIDGNLTQDHIDALRAMYPQMASDIAATISEIAAKPDHPDLTFNRREMLKSLTGGTPSGDGAALQGDFAGPPEAPGQPGGKPTKGSAKPRADKFPSTLTPAQRSSFGEGG